MITRLKLSTIEQGLPKYRSMLAGNAAYIPTSFESIATVTGTGSSTTITFSSIPSTYQHLQIRYIGKVTNTGGSEFPLDISLNSDTGTNYARHYLLGQGSTASSAGATSQTRIPITDVITDSFASYANMVGVGVIDIVDYANTSKYKTVRAVSGLNLNTAGSEGKIVLTSGLWMSTSAVSSISLITTSNWTTTSSFALYGIKGA